MKVYSRLDIKTGKVSVSIIVTNNELTKLADGGVVGDSTQEVPVTIVGYGKEEKQNCKTSQSKSLDAE